MIDAPNDPKSQRDAATLDAPAPLAYEAPRDQLARTPPANVLGMTFACMAGLIVSVFLTFVGTALAVVVPGDGYLAKMHVEVGIIFFLLAAGMEGILLRLTWRVGWRTVGRWWVLGLLLGAGVSFLLEGVCFFNKF